MADRHEGPARPAPAGRAAPGSPDPQQAADAFAAFRAGVVPPEPAGEAPEGDDGRDHERLVVRDLEELSAKAEKADEYLDLAQRTKADFENYRRRAEKKVGEAQERGVAKLAKELLPAIDNLTRAVQASEGLAVAGAEDTVESQLASGIRLVQADVLAALARVGIEPFSPTGEPFDPQLHEAVAHQPIDGATPGTVIEVYQQGYRLGEMVLRPARVLVAA